MKVYLHLRSQDNLNLGGWAADLARIPTIGEYMVFGPESAWYVVQAVQYLPEAAADCMAEVYAVEVDDTAVMRQLFGTAE